MQGAMDISPESWYLLAGDALSPPSFRGLSSVWGTNRQHCFICLDPVLQETPTKTNVWSLTQEPSVKNRTCVCSMLIKLIFIPGIHIHTSIANWKNMRVYLLSGMLMIRTINT